MNTAMTIEAIYENGVFRPTQPVALDSPQKVTLIVQTRYADEWPENAAEIYQEIAEEDRRLAERMWDHVKQTWPASEAQQ